MIDFDTFDYTDIKAFAEILRGKRESNLDKYDYISIYGYIYLIVLPDQRYYVGQKKYTPDKSESYYGSSKHLNNIINKLTGFSSKNFPKEIAEQEGIQKFVLDYALDQNELNFLEIFYIERAKMLESFDDQCLNIHDGGNEPEFRKSGHFVQSRESIEKAQETKRRKRELGLYVVSEETRMKMSNSMKETLKKKSVWNKGLTAKSDERVRKQYYNVDRSYLKTEEFKKKKSEASRGAMWYTNGIVNRRFKNINDVPDGFYPGMLGKETDASNKPCRNTKYGKEFSSVRMASLFYNCTEHSIIKSCLDGSYVSSKDKLSLGRFEFIDNKVIEVDDNE